MKRRRALLWVVVIIIVAAVVAFFAASRASVSALDEPGGLETAVATRAKRLMVARAAAKMHVQETPDTAESAKTGKVLFSMECAMCHGNTGRSPSRIGQSMYPRVPDLGSPEIQKWSDAELFWIVQHGVRLSGMPGFKKIDTDQQIWDLVDYVRNLPKIPSQAGK